MAVQPNDTNAVWVGGLSVYTKEDRLEEYFEECGDIVASEVFYENGTGRPLGRARVEFAHELFKKRALLLDQQPIDGRKMCVRDWVEMTAKRQPLPGRHEVFLASIGQQTNEDGIRWHFDDCGRIKQVIIFREREDIERSGKKKGQSQGRGKIIFATAEAAEKALRKNYSSLDNWTICVSAPDADRKPQQATRYWHDTRVLVPPRATQRANVAKPSEAPTSLVSTRRTGAIETGTTRSSGCVGDADAVASAGVVATVRSAGSGVQDNDAAFARESSACCDLMDVLGIAELRQQSFHEWLASMDGGRGALEQYRAALEQQLDSLPHLLSVYIKLVPGRAASLDESFFADMGIRKVGHKRLIMRWIESLVCRPNSAAT